MIGIDTNILVYAHRKDNLYHKKALNLMKNLSEGYSPWGITTSTLSEFYSIVTHKKIFQIPSTPVQALKQIMYWTESPSCQILAEGAGFLDALVNSLKINPIKGPLIHDLKILVNCELNGVKELFTMDRDFSKFSTNVRITRPF